MSTSNISRPVSTTSTATIYTNPGSSFTVTPTQIYLDSRDPSPQPGTKFSSLERDHTHSPYPIAPPIGVLRITDEQRQMQHHLKTSDSPIEATLRVLKPNTIISDSLDSNGMLVHSSSTVQSDSDDGLTNTARRSRAKVSFIKDPFNSTTATRSLVSVPRKVEHVAEFGVVLEEAGEEDSDDEHHIPIKSQRRDSLQSNDSSGSSLKQQIQHRVKLERLNSNQSIMPTTGARGHSMPRRTSVTETPCPGSTQGSANTTPRTDGLNSTPSIVLHGRRQNLDLSEDVRIQSPQPQPPSTHSLTIRGRGGEADGGGNSSSRHEGSFHLGVANAEAKAAIASLSQGDDGSSSNTSPRAHPLQLSPMPPIPGRRASVTPRISNTVVKLQSGDETLDTRRKEVMAAQRDTAQRDNARLPREGSFREGGASFRQGSSSRLKDDSLTESNSVNGTVKLRALLTELNVMRLRVIHLTNKQWDPTQGDAGSKELSALRCQVEEFKVKMSAQVVAMGSNIIVDTFETRRQVQNMFEDIFEEGEQGGNLALLTGLFRVSSIDFDAIRKRRETVGTCCRRGNLGYLALFLDEPTTQKQLCTDVRGSLAPLLLASIKVTETRPQIFQVWLKALLKHSSTLGETFITYASELQPILQKAFELIAQAPVRKELSNNHEWRSSRIDVLQRMMSIPQYFTPNCEAESALDGQTVFSRAAREGQVLILQLLLRLSEAAGCKLIDINRVQCDTSNALLQGIVGNHPKVVLFLCQQQGGVQCKSGQQRELDLSYRSAKGGTALELATKMKRIEIVEILEETLERRARSRKRRDSNDDAPDFLLTNEELAKKEDVQRMAEAGLQLVDISAVMHPLLEDAILVLESFRLPVPPTNSILKVSSFRNSGETEAADFRSKLKRNSMGILGAEPLPSLSLDQLDDIRASTNEILSTVKQVFNGHGGATKCRLTFGKLEGGTTGPEVKEMLLFLLDRYLRWPQSLSQDSEGKTLELLELLSEVMSSTTLDWGLECLRRKWLLVAANGAHVDLLATVLLQFSTLSQTTTLVAASGFLRTLTRHPTHRIPLVSALLTSRQGANMVAKFSRELTPSLSDFVANIASEGRAKEGEERKGRIQLLEKLLLHSPHLRLDLESEGSDGQNVLSRAAKEGDTEVIRLVLAKTDLFLDLNRVQSADNGTVLLHAVAGGHSAIVDLLVKASSSAAHCSSGSSRRGDSYHPCCTVVAPLNLYYSSPTLYGGRDALALAKNMGIMLLLLLPN